MQIKKIGHCCLIIKLEKITILTDPGSFTAEYNKNIKNIDIVLITHEHNDHIHVESLKEIIKNNPQVRIFTNTAVGKIIDGLNIKYEILEGLDKEEVFGVLIESFDAKHEEIYEQIGQVQNTGYFIDNKLFYPGDSYCDPKKKIEVLALPVAGPWCKVGDAIRYAIKLKPKKVFPVHDGMLQIDKIGGAHKVPENVLKQYGINFIPMVSGDEQEF